MTCANSTDPVPIAETRTLGEYPDTMIRDKVEGYVQFDVRVTEQGDAGELSLIAAVGPPELVRETAQAVKTWKWKPATLEGKPVAINTLTQMTFRSGVRPGARREFLTAYQGARKHIENEQWSEAKAVLDSAEGSPNLNLYERGMLANLAAQVAMKQGDYFEARRTSQLASNHSSTVLPRPVALGLWRTLIQASFAVGDIVGGLDAFDQLKSKGFGDPDTPIAKFVAEEKAKADAMPMLAISARIPQPGFAESLRLGLYRRVFSFKEVTGKLDRFVLSCKQQAVEFQVTDDGEWRVPANFSECNILVQGTPGTTFKVVQANP
jgi:TonB family protein